MNHGRIYALLTLSFVLHFVSFGLDAYPEHVALYDIRRGNPVVMTREDLAETLRLVRQSGLSEADTYMLYVVAREPMGADFVKRTNPVGPYGAYAKYLESLQQRGLVKDDRGVWILTDRGRRATSVPQQ